MMSLLRAENRKLFTIRSTFITMAFALLATGFFAFWVEGYKPTVISPHMLTDTFITVATILPLSISIIAILNVTHEYRFNTIMYTLTASNSRSKVLLAKLLVLAFWGVILAIAMAGFGLLMARLGVATSGRTMPPQDWIFWQLVGRLMFATIAYVLIGLLLALLFRNVTGAMIITFLGPGPIELLLSLVLKGNSKYLPFSALGQVTGAGGIGEQHLTLTQAIVVSSAYILTGFAVSWYLFLKRDAN